MQVQPIDGRACIGPTKLGPGFSHGIALSETSLISLPAHLLRVQRFLTVSAPCPRWQTSCDTLRALSFPLQLQSISASSAPEH